MDFLALQHRFAAYLRDPEHAPAPEGIEERRLTVYRELFFRNVATLLADAFPVLRRILGGASWGALVREFYTAHRARTPYFPELPAEFLEFLEGRGIADGEPPFLVELARHEWVELELQTAPDPQGEDGLDPEADLLASTPVLSPLVRAAAYAFPVHRLSPEFRPGRPDGEPTYLLAYRDRQDQVLFLQINALTARLIELLAEPGARTGRQLLAQLAQELRLEPDALLSSGAELLEDLRRRGVLLGGRGREESAAPTCAAGTGR